MRENPRKTILNAIQDFHPQDLSIGELTKETGMSRDTVSRHLKQMEEENLVKVNRKVGRAKMYTRGPKIEKLLEVDTEEEIHIYDIV